MYADPSRRRSFSPTSFGAALAVNTAIIGALMFAAPQVMPFEPIVRDFDGYNVPILPPPPPVDEVKPKPETKPQDVRETVIFTPKPIFDIQQPRPNVASTNVLPDTPPPTGLGTPTGTGEIKVEVPPPPLFIAADIDPRFQRAFQPDYPASEIRGEREGKVTVRVRIGTDGRVLAVEQVSATNHAFFNATRSHALARWRFKPATRGGKPEESWKRMTVTFVLTGDE
jgi:periplasmic protein TonB